MPRESFDDEIQTAPWLGSLSARSSVKGLQQANSTLQLRDSSGFSPDSPLIDFVFYFNYYLTEFYHKIFMPSIIFLVLYGLIQPRPMLSHLMLFILSEV